VYFCARAVDLLRDSGALAFISSNKWLRTGYGKRLRSYLGSHVAV
jgi:adenine-specific DNA-methyltransferase